MMGRKFIENKKQEFEIKEFVRGKFGKGKISDIKIERTPVGEKIIIYTTKPGLVIGKRGEVIEEISRTLRKKFKLENPRLEVSEITNPFFDAQTVADNIAILLERFGPLSFKIICYRELGKIKKAGALGVEIVLSGKLPSERAKKWRFAYGYLKKTGENKGIVKNAKVTAETMPGTIGVKVSIIPKDIKIPDKIDLSIIKDEIEEEIKEIKKEIKIEEEKIGEKETKKIEEEMKEQERKTGTKTEGKTRREKGGKK
jgi:small subunit ribosomal protein S3